MTGAELRASILQAAVQGRLVPQDPHDEPASALLDRVRTERAELVGQRKVKAPKGGESIIRRHLDGSVWEQRGKAAAVDITNEIPFDIPDGWEWVRAGDYGDWQAGATPAKGNSAYYRNGTIPWLLTGDLNDGHIVRVPHFITEKALSECSVRLNPVGSVLVAMYGATIGKTAILDIEATTNQACCACIPFVMSMNKWLFVWLKSNKQAFIDMGAGGAQPNISRTKIVSCLVPVPPLAEQQRITAKIGELMPLVERYDKLDRECTALNDAISGDMRASILQAAVRGDLTERNPDDEPASQLLERIRAERAELVRQKKAKAPKGGESVIWRINDGTVWEQRGKGKPVDITDEIPFDIPDGWEWSRAGNLCSVLTGTSYSKNDTRTSGIRILRGGNIQNDTLVLFDDDVYVDTNLEDSSKVPVFGDILYVASTGSKLVIGKAARVMDDLPNTQIGAFLRIARPLFTDISDYLWVLFRTPYYRERIKTLAFGTNICNVKAEYITEMLVPVPPLAEQRRIVARLDEMMPMVERLGVSANK